jgi:hypothetical protein
MSESTLEGGSYEVIRKRLLAEAAALGKKADALNEKRKKTFGGTEIALLATERVRTENNCVPRDIKNVGGRLLFGFNVFIGLRSETAVADVFSLHRFKPTAEGYDLSAIPVEAGDGLLGDPQFIKDFGDLYRYTRDVKLLSLRRTDGRLIAVFQAGATWRDTKVFRWGIDKSGRTAYIDSRGEEDNTPPRSHGFSWTQTTREDQVTGRFAHVAVLNEVFVETTGGDLTVKIENNTETGKGIYREPVEDPNQTLDDADIHYARVGPLILLKIRPFREQAYRYLVYNTRTRKVVRIDGIGLACLELPEDQGIVFPGGYYLSTGAYKVFDAETESLFFRKVIRSPNGEDVLYVFHRPEDGYYLLLPYNLIQKEVKSPIHCHGYSIFDDGKMIVFREQSQEPTRVHPMQIWQTPFTTAEFAASAPSDGSYLAKVGNADLVRGISEAYSLKRLAETESPIRLTFEDLIAGATRLSDAYYWLGHAEALDLRSGVEALRKTAEGILDEFEKALAIRKRAEEALTAAEAAQEELLVRVRPDDLASAQAFMEGLTAMRRQRGELITLRELRSMDLERVAALEAQIVAHEGEVSRAAVAFLLRPDALAPLLARLAAFVADVERAPKAADLLPLTKELDAAGSGLNLLAEIVSGLPMDDATARTKILESISEAFAQQNRARAILQSRRQALGKAEGRAEFVAQFKLFGQSVASAVAACDTPERCDAELSKLLLQLEELEGKFAEDGEFVAQLADKREELTEAIGAKRQSLLDERMRRARNLEGAAERILAGVARRARTFTEQADLNAYFASDPMLLKLRDLAAQLAALGQTVQAEGLESKLKAARQEALRSLRDKKDLFEDGAGIIKLGRHRFHVQTQPLELTIVPRESGGAERLFLHLTGTDFYDVLDDPTLEAARDLWSQEIPSESADVYRAEYLAASMLFDAEDGKRGMTLEALGHATLAPGGLLEAVRAYAADRHDEGYERGVHDADAALILEKLLSLRTTAGLLRFSGDARALACLYWAELADPPRALVQRRAQSLGRLRSKLFDPGAQNDLAASLEPALRAAAEAYGLPAGAGVVRASARYLVRELAVERPRFVASDAAVHLLAKLRERLELDAAQRAFDDDLRALERHPTERFALALAWLAAFTADESRASMRPATREAAALLVTERRLERETSAAVTEAEVTGLLGQHPRVEGRAMRLALDQFLLRLDAFVTERLPRYRAYRKARHEALERAKAALRLDELAPRVLTSFVRNRLIDEVYLPLVGANLAKQLGTAGDDKRTDRMGMLLLISPPGYGKTTLMEYVASQLGLVFMKVNGPALGHDVRSIDPADAPNATARQEVEKINLGLEMGNNVMLYLDDIQHTSSELLQKFISLCDGQRRIEGVWRGRTRTYDLRGKKFCIVMAGNPYTESGAKFQIPDMLANRADTYNLGDILEGKDDLFALSYLENALTSNRALAPLAGREPGDVHKLIRMARGEGVALTELSYAYAAAEVTEMVGVLERLFRVQATLLKVNLQYIASASQEDAYRTEPPFKLQGSYRNMNKLAEKIVAAHTTDEIERLVDDHYTGESQTLTTGAEQNLLKLAELRARLTPEQGARWEAIKAEYARQKRMGGKEDDPVTRLTGSLGGLGEDLEGIRKALEAAVMAAERRALAPRADTTTPIRIGLTKIEAALKELAKVQADHDEEEVEGA